MKDAMRQFGGGSRVCLGKFLAVIEQRHVVAAFYRAFPQGVQPAYGATSKNDDATGRLGMSDDDMVPQDDVATTIKGGRCYMELMQ